MSNICEKLGSNIEEVAYGMRLDNRIGKQFLNAGVGYGGPVFLKIQIALVELACEVNYDFHIFKPVIKVKNNQQVLLVKKRRPP